MMRKSLLFLLMFLMACIEVWAEGGTILIKGAESAWVYNSVRGRGRMSFKAEPNGKVLQIAVPEEQCRDLLYLIVDDHTSWIRLQPGETLTVKAGRKPWTFAGDEKQVNTYLYAWTQKYWFEKPNFLTATVQMMFYELAKERKVWPEETEICKPEYQEWVENWERSALEELQKARLKDEAFVAEQAERIHYQWIELQCRNFQMVKTKKEISEKSLEAVVNERFDKPGFLTYPGRDDVLRIYFEMVDESGLLNFSSTDFLRKRAERLALPELREEYVLNVLQGDFDYGYFYQGEKILESVKDLVISEEGQKVWEHCLEQCRAWRSDPKNPEGKSLVYFSFEDINGNEVTPSVYKGKYLLIDVWATWCGPCKAQIPYLKQLMQELEGRDIAFLSISADKPQDKEIWKKMVKEFGLEDHGVIASDAFNHRLFSTYEVKSIPRFILVGPDGKVLISKARRPSDPVLKKQLEELLDVYDEQKTLISGQVTGKEGMVSLMKAGTMWEEVAVAKIREQAFSLSAPIHSPGFYSLANGQASYWVWLTPGCSMKLDADATPVFSGDYAAVNNLMAILNAEYVQRFRAVSDQVYDRGRGRQLRKIYDDLVREIELTSLTPEEKNLVKGYWQGYYIQQMYGAIASAKVFGKLHQRPDVRKGYSDAVLALDLVPELVYSPQWLDVLEELLYARLEAGMIRIKGEDCWLADMALGIENEALREAYIMESLRLDILRGYLQGIEKRIESIRPYVKKTENQQLLAEMPKQIEQNRKVFANAMPGTDLSHFTFEDAWGKQVALADFKGKYIFIDMWSTGCNPCIGEIPYIRDMEKRFAGKPIVWVSISMDLKKEIWLDFLKKNKMEGIQLICSEGFKNPFAKQIGLGGIPHFLLLDKAGKILDVNTLRPSNPVLGELLELLLN